MIIHTSLQKKLSALGANSAYVHESYWQLNLMMSSRGMTAATRPACEKNTLITHLTSMDLRGDYKCPTWLAHTLRRGPICSYVPPA